jgi:hypothetical protein
VAVIVTLFVRSTARAAAREWQYEREDEEGDHRQDQDEIG